MLTRYRFRPGWITTAAFAVLLPSLIGLGFWQLERAADKAATRDQTLVRGQMAPVDVNELAIDRRAMNFRRARARGRYLEDWTIFLDNKVLNGVPGYEVLTPLALDGSERHLLVNRGWVPWGESRRTLPDVATPDGALQLSGRLREPPAEYFTLESPASGSGFRPLWQNLDLARYREATGLPVSPLVLELDPGEKGIGGFRREWSGYDDSWIDRHRAYAFQWFALALTLVVLYVVLNLRKQSDD